MANHSHSGLANDPLSIHSHGHDYKGPTGTADSAPGYVHHIHGPHSTQIANVLDPHVPGEYPSSTGVDVHSSSSNASSGLSRGIPSSTTSGSHSGGVAALGSHESDRAPIARTAGFEEQKFDPTSRSTGAESIGFPSSSGHAVDSTSTSRDQPEGLHHGRNAALGASAGAVGVGAYEADKHYRSGPTSSDPATKTTGPHSSNVLNVLDPRVLPEPEKMKDHNTSGPYKSDTLNTVDPRANSDNTVGQEKHHYGRDAALAGGVGAGGVGAFEATKHARDPALASSDPYSTNAAGTTGTTRQSGSGTGTLGSEYPQTGKEHHYGRDAAVVGGVGAAGTAAYGATRHDGSGLAAPQAAQQPLATPTGAPQDARIFDQTQQMPESRQVDAGWAADTKAQEKLHKQQVKEADKAHDKAVHDQKERAKEAEKAHDKAAKDHKGEKKHSLLGFLHRDKESKDTPEERSLKEHGNLREADEAAHLRHQRELEAAAATGGVSVAGASFEPPLEEQLEHPDASSAQRVSTDEKGHNRLHKEPPRKVQHELEERAREQDTYGTSASGTTANTTF